MINCMPSNVWVCYLICTHVLTSIIVVNGKDGQDLFSSTANMKKLFAKEENVRGLLLTERKIVDKEIVLVEKALQILFLNQKKGILNEQPNNILDGNLKPGYFLISKLIDWTYSLLGRSNSIHIISGLQQLPDEIQWKSAIDSMVLLHETYNLNLTDLSLGIINMPGGRSRGEKLLDNIESPYECSAMDLELFAKHAHDLRYFDRAYEFILAGIDKAKIKEEYRDQLSGMLKTLSVIKTDHDRTLMRKGPYGEDWRTFRLPFNQELRDEWRFTNIPNRQHSWNPKILDQFEPPTVVDRFRITSSIEQQMLVKEQFHMLCRGQELRSPGHDKMLRSFYFHHRDTYLKLGPFKLEEKNSSPFLAIFHDFFSNKEIRAFIAYAKPRLERSTHFSKGKKIDTYGTSLKRTSKQAWAPKEVSNNKLTHIRIVSRRIFLATLQNTTSGSGGEKFQIANYGIGGAFQHHMDSDGEQGISLATSETKNQEGDRLATFMGYLSDVDAGGATAYPAIGVTIWPKKGDAVYWYNIDTSSKADWWTYHGGCPVLHGTKWITNKWIRHYAQFSKFPCAINQRNDFSRFDTFSNPWH